MMQGTLVAAINLLLCMAAAGVRLLWAAVLLEFDFKCVFHDTVLQ